MFEDEDSLIYFSSHSKQIVERLRVAGSLDHQQRLLKELSPEKDIAHTTNQNINQYFEHNIVVSVLGLFNALAVAPSHKNAHTQVHGNQKPNH